MGISVLQVSSPDQEVNRAIRTRHVGSCRVALVAEPRFMGKDGGGLGVTDPMLVCEVYLGWTRQNKSTGMRRMEGSAI